MTPIELSVRAKRLHALRRALSNWRTTLGGGVLVLILAASLLAPVIGPFDPYA